MSVVLDFFNVDNTDKSRLKILTFHYIYTIFENAFMFIHGEIRKYLAFKTSFFCKFLNFKIQMFKLFLFNYLIFILCICIFVIQYFFEHILLNFVILVYSRSKEYCKSSNKKLSFVKTYKSHRNKLKKCNIVSLKFNL